MRNNDDCRRPGGPGRDIDATRDAGMFEVRMFGPLAVTVDGRSLAARDFDGVKPKQLFEILVAARGRPVAKAKLADLLWGEALPNDAMATLENYVSRLRRRLALVGGGGFVRTEHGAYRVDDERLDLDLSRFDVLVAEGDTVTSGRRRRLVLADALALVTGEVLSDEPYSPWAAELRETYGERHQHLLLESARLALADRDLRAALRHARGAVQLDATNEQACRLAMLASYASGDAQEALRAFERCQRALDHELGVDPFQETCDLRDAILGGDPAELLLPPASRVPPAMSRVRPLVGRERELHDVVDHVGAALRSARAAVVVVDGEPGIGRSRFLAECADLLEGVTVVSAACPALHRDVPYAALAALLRSLSPATFAARHPALAVVLPELADRPGAVDATPLGVLEAVAALLRDRGPLVLVVDDLHRADTASIAALTYACSRWSDAGLALVASVAPDELPPDHAARDLTATLSVRLQPLTEEELAPLGRPDLHRRTGGHPLSVVAVLDDDTALAPVAMVDFVLARAHRVGPRAHEVLVHAAALPEPVLPAALAALMGRDAHEVLGLLERLWEHRLLVVDGLGFRFRHPLARAALAATVSPARWAVLCEQVGALAGVDAAPGSASGAASDAAGTGA